MIGVLLQSLNKHLFFVRVKVRIGILCLFTTVIGIFIIIFNTFQIIITYIVYLQLCYPKKKKKKY